MTETVFAGTARNYRVEQGEMNDIMLFDALGNFVTRASEDIPLNKKKNFFDLLSEEDVTFFKENHRGFLPTRLLFDSTRGPLLVYCHLYAETGLYVAVLFPVKRESIRRFWKWGLFGEIKVSPTLREKTLPRKNGDFEEGELVERRFGMLAGVFDETIGSRIDRGAEDILGFVAGRLREVARLLGGAISTTVYERAHLREGYVLSFSCFVAVMSCLLSLARKTRPENEGKAEFFEQEGRCFVQLELNIRAYRAEKQQIYLFDYPELDYCREIAKRRDLLFDMTVKATGRDAVLSIRFSPDFRDPAVLGLKNPIDFYGMGRETDDVFVERERKQDGNLGSVYRES